MRKRKSERDTVASCFTVLELLVRHLLDFVHNLNQRLLRKRKNERDTVASCLAVLELVVRNLLNLEERKKWGKREGERAVATKATNKIPTTPYYQGRHYKQRQRQLQQQLTFRLEMVEACVCPVVGVPAFAAPSSNPFPSPEIIILK